MKFSSRVLHNIQTIILILFLSIFLLFMWSNKPSYKKEGFDDSRPSFNKKIDAIYYINLDKRTDRKQEFLDNFNEVDEDRIMKITGHHYPDNGAVGCLMSHVTALNKALSNGKGENILICEDDFIIKDMDYFNKMLNLFFENIKKWDVVMLGHNTVESKDTGIKTKNNEKIIRVLNSQTTSGYLIKQSYIPTLLDIYAKDLTEYMKTGKWGNYFTDQSWKVLQPVDNWYAFEPSVGFQRPSYSDIQNGFISVEV